MLLLDGSNGHTIKHDGIEDCDEHRQAAGAVVANSV
jgi:hypothetical protein